VGKQVADSLIIHRMLVTVKPRDGVAVWRLLEFLSDRTPWHRSLWGVGVVLAMEELYEACVVSKQGHLSEAAIKRMAAALQKRVGTHPAFTEAEKHFLKAQVHQIPRADGPAHFGIRELSARISTDYLARWGRAAAAQEVSVENFSRSVAAHLLDAGFSGPYLYNLIRSKIDAPEAITLPDLCNALQAELAATPRREFEVLLAFAETPELPNGVPEGWLRGSSVTTWLEAHGYPTTNVRAPVAMILKVQARDDVGAASLARGEADRYAARALIATGKELRLLPNLWVRGASSPFPLKAASRGVGVKELFREDRVFSADASQSVDAALELLAHLDGSSPTAAIAGGWGAIEGLLADPSDRASAADNLATLVTCSFPRAELTALSYRAERQHPQACGEITAATTNRERARAVGKMIIEGRMPHMRGEVDQATVLRLGKLLGNPGPALQTIRDSIGESFHRLYRQRNLILHGGRLDSVALSASLRTVAKLAGAGMDRITHGWYVQQLRPMELVARANLSLALASREDPLSCVDLLEMN